MKYADQERVQIRVDLSIFPIEVVLMAAYGLVDKVDFEFGESDLGHLALHCTALVDSMVGTEKMTHALHHELTQARIQRLAHEDQKGLRTLMATAAFSRGVSEEALVSALSDELPTTETRAYEAIEVTRTGNGLEGWIHYCIAQPCCSEAVFRALSYVQDLGDAIVTEIHGGDGMLLQVKFRNETCVGQWEKQMSVLIPQCASGGKNAIYVPVFSMESGIPVTP